MEFYEEFADKYDNLVSWKNRIERESHFFKKIFSENNVKTILDCACGTGHHVLMLNKMKFNAKGSDLSKKMIEQAKVNSQKYGIKAQFLIADLRSLSKEFSVKFDALICVGNSLPHLFSDRDLTSALNEMYKILNKNGILILEQRNFDKLVKNQIRFFPVSFRENEIFFYVLDYYPKQIIFNVIHIEVKNKSFKTYSTEYNPLKKEDLVMILQNLGFRDLKFYQDHEFNKFNLNSSDHLIIVCKK